jgi:hypothetical protein
VAVARRGDARSGSADTRDSQGGRNVNEDDGDAPYEEGAYEEDAYEDDEEGPEAEYDDDEEGGPEDEYDEDEASEEPEEEQGGIRAPRASSSQERRRPNRQLSALSAAQAGLRNLSQLTTNEPSGITSVEPSDQGWVVGIEVVEDKRVPSSADVMAIYEAEIDDDENLVSYRRVRSYSRGQGDKGGGGAR